MDVQGGTHMQYIFKLTRSVEGQTTVVSIGGLQKVLIDCAVLGVRDISCPCFIGVVSGIDDSTKVPQKSLLASKAQVATYIQITLFQQFSIAQEQVSKGYPVGKIQEVIVYSLRRRIGRAKLVVEVLYLVVVDGKCKFLPGPLLR